MGLIDTKLTVLNPTDTKRFYSGKFLVDTGTIYTVVPEDVWKKLGLKSEWQQDFSMANGQTVSRNIGNAMIKYAGRTAYSPIVLGEKNDQFLLGAVTLENLGLAIDPFNRKIYRNELMTI